MIKVNDYGVILQFQILEDGTLLKDDGTIEDTEGPLTDLDTATSITLNINYKNQLIHRPCTLVNKTLGLVAYVAEKDLFNVAGTVIMDITILYPNGEFTTTMVKEKVINTAAQLKTKEKVY